MIKGMLAAGVLLFGLGLNVASAQEIIRGPADYEKLLVTHAAVCSSFKDIRDFLTDNHFVTVFTGANDIASISKGKEVKPSGSNADVMYSDTLKAAITIVYDRKQDVGCIMSGIKNATINEDGLNHTLGYKVSE